MNPGLSTFPYNHMPGVWAGKPNTCDVAFVYRHPVRACVCVGGVRRGVASGPPIA